MLPLFQDLNLYYGDLHSHCNVGYGHGSLEDALQNARLQLDFACITPHAHWADLPEKDERLAAVVEYHKQGFARTAAGWSQVQERVDEAYEPGRFVTFLGQEWHSLAAGDYNIYFKEPPGEIVRAATAMVASPCGRRRSRARPSGKRSRRGGQLPSPVTTAAWPSA